MHKIDFSEEKLLKMHQSILDVWNTKYKDIVSDILKNYEVKTFLDLGANTGSVIEFFNPFLGKETKIICFEPAIENFNLLLENLKFLDRDKNSIVYNKAVFYGLEESRVFGVGDGNTGGMFLEGTLPIVDPNDHRKPVLTELEFKCTTLEKELNDIDFIDLCKIDVEGSEYNILTNSTILSEKTNHIILEYHWKKEDEIIDWLSHNFKSHEIITTIKSEGMVWLKKK